MEEQVTPPSVTKNKVSVSLDYRLVILILLGIIITMLVIWKPWQRASATSDNRTVSVTGDAKVTAEPDEYIFVPNYQFQGNDKAVVLAELTKKSDEIVAKLKSLGIKDTNIKTNSSGNEYNYNYYYDPDTKKATYNLSLTITLPNRSDAQKVQDYLVTTNPTGAVSPQAQFSDAKRKELESQARDKATKEARAKADQSAKNLGFKIGAVKSVDDGSGFGNTLRYDNKANVSPMASDGSSTTQLAVQPGQNDLSYSVSVVYYLR